MNKSTTHGAMDPWSHQTNLSSLSLDGLTGHGLHDHLRPRHHDRVLKLIHRRLIPLLQTRHKTPLLNAQETETVTQQNMEIHTGVIS